MAMLISLTKFLPSGLFLRNEKLFFWFLRCQAKVGCEAAFLQGDGFHEKLAADQMRGLQPTDFNKPQKIFDVGKALVWLDETNHTTKVVIGTVPDERPTIVHEKWGRIALLCFKRAARLQYAPAQRKLAEIFHYGWMSVSARLEEISIVQKNFSAYRKWLFKAAENGDSSAQAELAQLFNREHKYKAAAAWYLLSAEQGESSAQNNLACLFARGEGVPKDMEKAKSWWMKAAEQNEINAQVAVGDLFFRGVTVLKNVETAKQWYQRAATLGSTVAKERLAKLKP
jgi:TPR repeat protein